MLLIIYFYFTLSIMAINTIQYIQSFQPRKSATETSRRSLKMQSIAYWKLFPTAFHHFDKWLTSGQPFDRQRLGNEAILYTAYKIRRLTVTFSPKAFDIILV